jgi:putative hemolysin
MAAYHQLEGHLVHEEMRTTPLPVFACPAVSGELPKIKIPKLLSAYLMLGSKICGPPALDREFKTIDFLTLLDIKAMPAKVLARYFG